jgi:YidC/Oxa1 family membrane protein insertase
LLDFLGAVGSAIMTPLYYVVSVLLVGFHTAFAAVLGEDSDWAWALSIVGLTVVIRILLIPLFVKQIKTSRNMAMLQPKVKDLQKKYGHDRERLAQETMKLYKDTGTNPLASCMPLLLQAPIFFALFRTLDDAANGKEPKGIMTEEHVEALANATIFGSKISDSFLRADSLHVQILTIALVIIMTITTFTTQRQLMRKNMPEAALSGPYASQQKLLLYILPLVFAVGGIAFPVGVLLYWTTSNIWTMGQQFYVIRNNPAPGTPAEKAKEERDARKAARHHKAPADPAASNGTAPPVPPAAQPRRKRGSGSSVAKPGPEAAGTKPGGSSVPPPKSRNQPKKVPRSKRRTPGKPSSSS